MSIMTLEKSKNAIRELTRNELEVVAGGDYVPPEWPVSWPGPRVPWPKPGP